MADKARQNVSQLEKKMVCDQKFCASLFQIAQGELTIMKLFVAYRYPQQSTALGVIPVQNIEHVIIATDNDIG